MTTQIVFLLFIAVALVGWAIAELKSRAITFVHSEEEAEEAAIIDAELAERDYRELNLKDLLAHNSTNGYSAL